MVHVNVADSDRALILVIPHSFSSTHSCEIRTVCVPSNTLIVVDLDLRILSQDLLLSPSFAQQVTDLRAQWADHLKAFAQRTSFCASLRAGPASETRGLWRARIEYERSLQAFEDSCSVAHDALSSPAVGSASKLLGGGLCPASNGPAGTVCGASGRLLGVPGREHGVRRRAA
jgi:hypothetical protein